MILRRKVKKKKEKKEKKEKNENECAARLYKLISYSVLILFGLT
jgi:hypothetical protein